VATTPMSRPRLMLANVVSRAVAARALRLISGSTDAAVLRRYSSVSGRPSVDPLMSLSALAATARDTTFANIRRGLLIGVVATLLLIGASLLVSMLEQLREQRRTLAVLVAFGTRRSTLSWSVLWQTAVPVLLGLVLAVVAGTGLGALLLTLVGEPVRLDWSSVGASCGVAALVVLLVTALSLPALWRLVRPEALRTE
jgi:predicted lysophospholipase L1 biosynthesis ABC-type transport system permease subunit